MLFVFITSIILGAFMYSIEGDINRNLSSIPKGIYWAIVTLTTVGYGDITPVTNFGQIIAGTIMILGYSIIAVPTGIISADFIASEKKKNKNNEDENSSSTPRICPKCNLDKNDDDAIFCKRCGSRLDPNS
jgi:voltage-gated potassium channel